MDLAINRRGSGVGLWCVDCHADGSFQIGGSGSVGWTGISSLEAHMTGSAEMTIDLGIAASGSMPVYSLNKTLASVALPGFGIEDVISIGPQIDLLAELSLTMHAAGQIEGGATGKIGPFVAELDLFNQDNNQFTGFDPTFTTIGPKSATGQVGATLDFSLPVQFGFGLDIVGFDSKTVNLQDKPGLTFDATYHAAGDGSCSPGVSLDLTAHNDIDLNAFNFASYNIDTWTSPPLVQGCVKT